MSRNSTTLFLKECIANALFQLIKEKPIDTITIKEITKVADVGRVTYYRNFDSKEDVLIFKISLLAKRWIEEHSFNEIMQPSQMMVSYFEFLLSIKDYIEILYNAKRVYLFQEFTYNLISPESAQLGPRAYKDAFYVYGVYGIAREWIKSGFQETPNEMSELVTQEIFNENNNYIEKIMHLSSKNI